MATTDNMNPFSMPPEAEFFWLHNTDHRKSEVEHPPNAKVWEKSTCASRYSATAALRDDDLPMPMVELPSKKLAALEEQTPDDTFLTTIATKPSVGLLDPLKYTEKDIRQYVQKKRDVFLLQMGLDVKQDEIVRLDEKARKKEEALTKSQQILDNDARKFEEFLHSRYAQGQSTMKNAEEQSKKKQDKLGECKKLRREIASMQSEIGKLTEDRKECMRYKTFLEKLTPTEWKEQQKEVKLTRKARRKEQVVAENMKGILARLAEEERAQERADEEKHEEAKRKPGARRLRKQEQEEERLRLEKERAARRKRFLKRQKDEEQKIANAYVEVSSEEEAELHFKHDLHGSSQLMSKFTELEERNLSLIQSSQEKEQQLDEFQVRFESTKKDLENKVGQLRDNIKQLDHSINQERRRGDELRRSYEEKASVQAQEEKLADLWTKVQDVYLRCGLSMDHDPDTLQMLASIEARLEELIRGLEEAYLRDGAQIKRLELQKQKERRERLREQKLQDALAKQEERLKISLQRSQNPVFKKAGKQVMYRSPPLRQEKRVVRDTSEDEANARDHRVFDIFIDRKGLPQAEAPVIEDPRKALSSRIVASRAAATEKAQEDEMVDETKLGTISDPLDIA